MKPRLSGKSEKGSVAIEMAFVLPILILLLTLMVFFARIFWVYSTAQKAAHDAARFLSTATQAEIRTGGGGFNEARYPAIARWIAQEELMDVLPWVDTIAITPLCDTSACNATVPGTVRVKVEISLQDDIFTDLITDYLGNPNVVLKSSTVLTFVGR